MTDRIHARSGRRSAGNGAIFEGPQHGGPVPYLYEQICLQS